MAHEDDTLRSFILDDRIKGLSYSQIEAKHGIPALEAMAIVREAIESTTVDDVWEQRGIQMLRIEKTIEYLWKGVEEGSFKHAEALIKAIERLSEMLDLNKETIKHEITIISDEETLQMLAVLKQNNVLLKQKIIESGVDPQSLEEWPEWASHAATTAVAEIEMQQGEDGTWLPIQ